MLEVYLMDILSKEIICKIVFLTDSLPEFVSLENVGSFKPDVTSLNCSINQ
jgi:hypothetical protein